MNKRIKIVITAIIAFTLLAGAVGFGIHASAPAEVVTAAVVRQGSRGETVKTIQQKLKRWGYYKGSVDGIYGSGTRAAVIAFQKKNGLTPDGIVGNKTLAALGISTSSSSSSTSSGSGGYSSSDVNLLARLIYGEARGESYTGQVAVGAVVMNRVKSASFPNTISGVIYQPYAFTAVADGQVNLAPDATAIKAAKAAMSGWDPTGGAIYYYNPATATSKWIYSRKTTLTIGNHVFAI